MAKTTIFSRGKLVAEITKNRTSFFGGGRHQQLGYQPQGKYVFISYKPQNHKMNQANQTKPSKNGKPSAAQKRKKKRLNKWKRQQLRNALPREPTNGQPLEPPQSTEAQQIQLNPLQVLCAPPPVQQGNTSSMPITENVQLGQTNVQQPGISNEQPTIQQENIQPTSLQQSCSQPQPPLQQTTVQPQPPLQQTTVQPQPPLQQTNVQQQPPQALNPNNFQRSLNSLQQYYQQLQQYYQPYSNSYQQPSYQQSSYQQPSYQQSSYQQSSYQQSSYQQPSYQYQQNGTYLQYTPYQYTSYQQYSSTPQIVPTQQSAPNAYQQNGLQQVTPTQTYVLYRGQYPQIGTYQLQFGVQQTGSNLQ